MQLTHEVSNTNDCIHAKSVTNVVESRMSFSSKSEKNQPSINTFSQSSLGSNHRQDLGPGLRP